MSAAAILDRAYGRNADKKAARDFRISVAAIRWWRRYGFPKGREEQIRRVLAERIEENIAVAHETLALIRHQWSSDEKSSAVGRLGSGGDRGRAPTRGAVDRQEDPP